MEGSGQEGGQICWCKMTTNNSQTTIANMFWPPQNSSGLKTRSSDVKIYARCGSTNVTCLLLAKTTPKHQITFLTFSKFPTLVFFPQHMLRVSFSPGRDRIRRHDWIPLFWSHLRKRPLFSKMFPLPSLALNRVPFSPQKHS